MDLDSVLQRIGNYRGVTGYIVLNQEGNVITSTLSDEEVRPLATLVYRVCLINSERAVALCFCFYSKLLSLSILQIIY